MESNTEIQKNTDIVETGDGEMQFEVFKQKFHCTTSIPWDGSKALTLSIDKSPVFAPISVILGVGDKKQRYNRWLTKNLGQHLKFYGNIIKAMKDSEASVLHLESKSRSNWFQVATLSKFINENKDVIFAYMESNTAANNTLQGAGVDIFSLKESIARQQLTDKHGEGNFTDSDIVMLASKITFNESGTPTSLEETKILRSQTEEEPIKEAGS